MPSKIVKQARINQIVDLLMKGTRSADIIRFCSETFGVGQRCSEKYINQAKPLVVERMNTQREIVKSKEVELIEQIATDDLLSIAQKRKILAAIANGEMKLNKVIGYELVTQVVEEINSEGEMQKGMKEVPMIITAEVLPGYIERLRAIDLDNKMTGDNAPEKVDLKVGKKQVFKIGGVELEFGK